MRIRFRILRTRAGHIGFAASDKGVCRIWLPEEKPDTLRAEIRKQLPDAAEERNLLPDFCDELTRYFAGEEVQFTAALDFGRRTAFELQVLRACRKVAYGRTASYGELAERVGRPGGARAVGMTMSRNPLPIVVPCHRVLRSDGSLGGYSGPGGLEFKRGLLKMEASAVAGGV